MAGQDIEAASYPGRSMAVAAADAAPTAAREQPDLGHSRLRDLGRPVLIALAAIVLIGFAVRAWAATHPVVNPGPDADAYASLARALFEHHTYGTAGQSSTSDWSPGAPLLFGAVYWITGGVNPEAARLVVAVLGAVMVGFTFAIGRRVG